MSNLKRVMNAVEEITGPGPEIFLEYNQILKEGRRFWDDVNGGYLPEDLVLVARREGIDLGYILKVFTRLFQCKDAGMKPLDLTWVDTDKSVDPTHKKTRSRLCAREYKTKKQGKIQRVLSTRFTVVICNATSRSCEGACLNHDVGEFVEQRETIEVETLRHQWSTFSRNSPETHLHQNSSRGSRRQSRQITHERVWSSRRFPHLAA